MLAWIVCLIAGGLTSAQGQVAFDAMRQLTRTDISKPVVVPFVRFRANSAEFHLKIDIPNKQTSLVAGDQLIALPNNHIPLAVEPLNNSELVVFARPFFSTSFVCFFRINESWRPVELPDSLSGCLFRASAIYGDSIVLIAYDMVKGENVVHRLRFGDGKVDVDPEFREPLVLKTLYEQQERILTSFHNGDLLISAGRCIARYGGPANEESLKVEYLRAGSRIHEIACNLSKAFAIVQSPATRESPSTFQLLDLNTMKVKTLTGLPFGLTLRGDTPEWRNAQTLGDLNEIFIADVERSKGSGVMSLGMNNLRGEVVWSQEYWLTGMVDLLTMTKKMAGDLALHDLLGEIKIRLDIEMALLDELLASKTGLNCQEFTTDNMPQRFAVQSGKTLLLLKRYLFSPAPIELKSFRKFATETAELRNHAEILKSNQGEEASLPNGCHYLQWPNGVNFKYDGVGVPFNHQNCWAAGVLHAEDTALLNDVQLLAARDIAVQVLLLEDAFQAENRKHWESGGDVLFDWYYWWGRAKEGWKPNDNISQNTPDWSGDGENFAMKRYLTFDAIAFLSAKQRFPSSVPDWVVDFFADAVKAGELEPFLIPYLARHNRFPSVPVEYAISHIRVDSQTDFRNVFWAYCVYADSLNSSELN